MKSPEERKRLASVSSHLATSSDWLQKCQKRESCLHVSLSVRGQNYFLGLLLLAIILSISYIHMFTQDGQSALMRAALWGKTEVIVELLKAKATVDLQDNVCICTCDNRNTVYSVFVVCMSDS